MVFSFVRTPYRIQYHCQHEIIVYDNIYSEPICEDRMSYAKTEAEWAERAARHLKDDEAASCATQRIASGMPTT